MKFKENTHWTEIIKTWWNYDFYHEKWLKKKTNGFRYFPKKPKGIFSLFGQQNRRRNKNLNKNILHVCLGFFGIFNIEINVHNLTNNFRFFTSYTWFFKVFLCLQLISSWIVTFGIGNDMNSCISLWNLHDDQKITYYILNPLVDNLLI